MILVLNILNIPFGKVGDVRYVSIFIHRGFVATDVYI